MNCLWGECHIYLWVQNLITYEAEAGMRENTKGSRHWRWSIQLLFFFKLFLKLKKNIYSFLKDSNHISPEAVILLWFFFFPLLYESMGHIFNDPIKNTWNKEPLTTCWATDSIMVHLFTTVIHFIDDLYIFLSFSSSLNGVSLCLNSIPSSPRIFKINNIYI